MDQIVTKKKKDDFKMKIQQELMDNYNLFWENMKKLPAKDFCDVWMKLLPYGFAKAPEERPLDDNKRAQLIAEETTRKVAIIAGGVPEDVEYEDDIAQ